jgi:PAS domain-containing protein
VSEPSHAMPAPARRLAALRSSEELALLALAALPEMSVIVFDRQLRVVLAAGEALAIHGHDRDELEGRALSAVLPARMLERF